MAQLRNLTIGTLLIFQTACTVPVDHQPPELTAPPAWDEASPQTTGPLEQNWWRAFNSTELEQLITETLSGSPDIRIATERVWQAEIALRHSRASLFPVLNLEAATRAGRSISSDDTTVTSESSRVGLAINYEIDIRGSNYASWQGRKASYAATRHDYEAMRLSLVAGVANAYWQILAIRDRLAIARQNLTVAERLFAIVEARYRYGTATVLDVSRQRTTVMTQRDTLLPLEIQERQNLRALALLIGRLPQGFNVTGNGLDDITVPQVPAVLPSELLLRRPDIAASEERLVAASANVAVARAALLPLKLNLGLSTLVSSSDVLFAGLGSPAHSGDIIVALTRALFDGGRLRGQVEARQSEQRILVENWRKTVLTALKEVDDALAIVHRSQTQERTQREIRDETLRSLELSELRFKEGSDGLTTLLEAQRSLFAIEERLIQQKLSRLNATADLYKALGGGWQAESQKRD